MSYPRYPAYKQSGVGWLGEVPAHWTELRLKFVSTINAPRSEALTLPLDTEVSFVPMEAVGEYGGLVLEQTRQIQEVLQGYSFFRDGDIVLAKITPCFENGKGALATGLVGGMAFGTTELHTLRALKDVDPRFIFYVTLSQPFRKLGEGSMYGAGGQKRVPESFVSDYLQPLPPPAEQAAIAAFLDRETAQIDALIAKQERLIGLLQEKRQALISHAVTKGLDPAAPMKESGVEWLGEVPAHWEVVALKRLVAQKITDGPHETPALYDDGVPFLSAEAVKDSKLDFTRRRGYIDKETLERYSQKCQLARNDVLLVKSGNTTGTAAIVDTDDIFAIWSPLAQIRANTTTVMPKYLYWSVLSSYFQHLVKLSASYGTQPNIGMGTLENLPVVLPPLVEQRKIVCLLDQHDCKIREVEGRCRRVIELASERRAALIAAAVTGQIDVRGA